MTRWRTLLTIASLATTVGCYEREEPGDNAELGDTDTDTGSDGGETDGGDSSQPGSTSGSGADETGGDSGADDGGTDGSEPNDSDGGLDQLIGAICDWDFECCSQGELDYRLGPFTQDAADCTERFVEQLHSNDNMAQSPRSDLLYTLGFAVRLDRSSPNADMVAQCTDQIAGRGCNQPWDGDVYCEPGDAPVDNPCDLRNLFTGTQTIGEPCSQALANFGYDIECEAGSSCEEVDGSYVCVDKGLIDEFCEADNTCDQGLFCDLSNGRCAPKRDLGDTCAFKDSSEPDAGTETLQCLEHLSCDPQTNTCVQYCSTGYDCAVDEQCPQGQSCIPVDIGDKTYTYCQPRGDSYGDRCDSDHDCADGFHCEGDSCAADRTQGTDCSADNQCATGLYCDIGFTNQCEIVINANQPCQNDRECNPKTTLGCITSDDGALCRSAMLSNGDDCVPAENEGASWCSSGVCEDTTDDFLPNPTCHVGALEGEECDSSPATYDVHECAQGLYCLEGFCKAKLDSGSDCEEDGGQQCLNAQCIDVWEGQYCSDAVPVGTYDELATCDGVE